MNTKAKRSADVSSIVDDEMHRVWRKLAAVSGQAAFAYPAIIAQGPAARDVCRALNQALDGLAEADRALETLSQLMSRIHH